MLAMTGSTVYEALGLVRNPFPPTPDAGSYFFTPQLEEEFAEIFHCIEARKGFVLLTGEVGLGKSTLVRRLLDTLPEGKCHSALILNTFLQGSALLSAIQVDFGLPPTESLEQGLSQLTDFLLKQHQKNNISLLVIDDAQNLSIESLELVRLLCNLETAQEKLLQIFLVGQPELEQTLEQTQLRQLKSRIVKHTRLTGLKREELACYFDFRINASQAKNKLSIQPTAVDKLHQVTKGNLRQIHLILDRCLYGLVTTKQTEIDVRLLGRAIDDTPSLINSSNHKYNNKERSNRQFFWLGGLMIGITTLMWMDSSWWRDYLQPGPPSNTITLTENNISKIADLTKFETNQEKMKTSLSTNLELRQCEQKLISIAKNEEVLISQQLPRKISETLKPSPKLCLFSINGEPWASWLSPHQVHHIQSAKTSATQMQIMLKHMGFLRIQAPDGLFGPKTGEALLKFQQENHLPPTGQPDDLTFLLLENLNVPTR